MFAAWTFAACGCAAASLPVVSQPRSAPATTNAAAPATSPGSATDGPLVVRYLSIEREWVATHVRVDDAEVETWAADPANAKSIASTGGADARRAAYRRSKAGETTHRLAVAVAVRIEKAPDPDRALDAAIAKVLGDAAATDGARPRLVPLSAEGVRASHTEECAHLLRAATEGAGWAVVYPLDGGNAYLVAKATRPSDVGKVAEAAPRPGRCSGER